MSAAGEWSNRTPNDIQFDLGAVRWYEALNRNISNSYPRATETAESLLEAAEADASRIAELEAELAASESAWPPVDGWAR